MLTVCMSDGIYPDENHKLRNILRRSQTLSRTTFQNKPNFLADLSNIVVDTLGDNYPEINKNHNLVQSILQFEEDNYENLLEKGRKYMKKIHSEFPDIKTDDIDVFDSFSYYESLKCLDKTLTNKVLDGKLSYKLYESFGMEESNILNIANLLGLKFNVEDFYNYFNQQKVLSKYNTSMLQDKLENQVYQNTGCNDDQKYNYSVSEHGEYSFPEIKSKINFITGGKSKLVKGETGSVSTSETNFYSEAGGQVGDRGWLRSNQGVFLVEDTKKISGEIHHIGHVCEG